MKRNIQNSDKITRKNADIDHVCASPPSSVMHALDESWLVSMVAFFFYPLPSPLSTPILLKESFFVNLLKKLFLLFFLVKELLSRILIFIAIEILSSSVCIMKFNQIILFECLFYPKKIQVASRQVFISKIFSLYCTKRIDFHCRHQIETPLAQIAKSFFFGFFLSLTIGKHHFKLTQSLWAYRKSWKLTHFQQWCTPTHKCHMLKYQRFNNRTSEKLQPNFFWLTGEILHFFLLSSIGCNMTSLMSSKASERRLSYLYIEHYRLMRKAIIWFPNLKSDSFFCKIASANHQI